MENDNIQQLYNSLAKRPKFKDLKFDEFKNDMQDENNRKELYNSLSKVKEFPKVAYEDFSSDMGFVATSTNAQSPKPLSNKEAQKAIYSSIPGEIKFKTGATPINTLGLDLLMKEKFGKPLPSYTQTVDLPEHSVYNEVPQVKPMTSTFDENAPVNDYIPNEYEKQQFQQAQTINKGVTEQEFNPQFYKDVPQGAINSLASIGSSALKGVGDLYSKLGKVTPTDFYDSYGKTLQDLGEKANTYAKKNSNGSAGQKIGGILPLAGAAVADIATEGALTPAITSAFAASGYGDGIQMYDEINKGKETNELARTGAGLLYGSVMAGASNFLVGKAIPKGILSDAVQSVFKSNPELLQSGGEAVINSFAKAQPGVAKQLVQNTLHGVGTMETMELSKNAIDELYGKHHDLKDWINTATEAAVTGALYSAMTSPFSIHAQSEVNDARRNAQGQVTLTFDEKGKPVEVLNGNKGLTPNGKEVKLSEKSLNNAYTLTTEDFNNAIQQHKTEGKATIDDRKVFSNNVANTLNKLSNNGVVTVSHDENGSALYVISPTETGYKAMNTSGELVDIPKESNLEQAHVADVHQSIMNEYDKQRNSGDNADNNDILTLALSQPEKIINPDIPEGTDVTDPTVHIQSGIDILDAKQAMDAALEGTKFYFDSNTLNTDPEARKAIVTNVMNDTDFSDEQKQSILNYISAEAKSMKLREADQQSVDTRMQQAQQELEKSINQKTGTLVTVRIKGDEKGEPMPVIDGLAIKTDDNNQENPYIPDIENSDKKGVFYVDEDGLRQVTTADNLDVVSNTTPEETLSALQNQLVNDYQQRQQVVAEGINSYQLSVTPKSPEGDLKSQVDEFVRLKDGTYGTITNVTPEGYEVTSDNGTSKMVSENDIIPETQLRGLSSGDTVKYTTSTGSVTEGVLQIEPTLRKEGKVLVNDEEIPISSLVESGKHKAVSNESVVGSGESVVNNQEATDVAVPKYPVLEDGSPDFEKMTDNQILEHTKETEGEEAAQALAVRQVKRLQSQISENQRNTAKLTEETNKLLAKSKTMQEDKAINAKQSAKGIALSDEADTLSAKLKELQAYLPKEPEQSTVSSQQSASPNLRPEIAQLQKEQAAKQVSSEQSVIGSEEKPKPTQVTPFQQRQQNLGEYMDMEDYILRAIAGGQKFKWKTDGVKKGIADELGFSEKNGERLQRRNLIDEQNGLTPQEFSHEIYNVYGEDGNNGEIPGVRDMSDREILDIVNHVLLSTKSNAHALEQSEAKRNNYDLNAEDYAIYNSFTPEEVNYLEQIPDDILESYLGLNDFTPEQNDFINNLQNEYGNTNTEPTNTSASERGEGVAEQSAAERDTEELDNYISEQEHNTHPTEKQKETGIYAKARVNLQHHNITIETLKGTERSGIDEGGQKWSVTMQNHYGELDGTIGYDGDPIDVFIGPNPKEGEIYVVDQVNPASTTLSNQFDESKVMLGFDSAEEAKAAYLSNYEEGWSGFSAITPAGEKFKQWLYDGKKQRKPFAEYKDTPDAVISEQLSVNSEETKPQSLSDFDFKDEDITKAKKKCIPRPKGGFVL